MALGRATTLERETMLQELLHELRKAVTTKDTQTEKKIRKLLEAAGMDAYTQNKMLEEAADEHH